MKRFLSVCVALTLATAFVGCDQKAEIKKETTVTTPDGETTKTDTTTIEKSGDHKTP